MNAGTWRTITWHAGSHSKPAEATGEADVVGMGDGLAAGLAVRGTIAARVGATVAEPFSGCRWLETEADEPQAATMSATRASGGRA